MNDIYNRANGYVLNYISFSSHLDIPKYFNKTEPNAIIKDIICKQISTYSSQWVVFYYTKINEDTTENNNKEF